jgi:hypothetical protein
MDGKSLKPKNVHLHAPAESSQLAGRLDDRTKAN